MMQVERAKEIISIQLREGYNQEIVLIGIGLFLLSLVIAVFERRGKKAFNLLVIATLILFYWMFKMIFGYISSDAQEYNEMVEWLESEPIKILQQEGRKERGIQEVFYEESMEKERVVNFLPNENPLNDGYNTPVRLTLENGREVTGWAKIKDLERGEEEHISYYHLERPLEYKNKFYKVTLYAGYYGIIVYTDQNIGKGLK